MVRVIQITEAVECKLGVIKAGTVGLIHFEPYSGMVVKFRRKDIDGIRIDKVPEMKLDEFSTLTKYENLFEIVATVQTGMDL